MLTSGNTMTLAAALAFAVACSSDDGSQQGSGGNGGGTGAASGSGGSTASGPGAARADPAGDPNWCIQLDDGVHVGEPQCERGPERVVAELENNALVALDGRSCVFVGIDDSGFCKDLYDCEGCSASTSFIPTTGKVLYGCDDQGYCGSYVLERRDVMQTCDPQCASLCAGVAACLDGCGC